MIKTIPDAHISGTLKQLSTPWKIASERAYRLSKMSLKDGYILDIACGSGVQLAAYSSTLNKPCIGIEIDPVRAEIAENTLKSILKKNLSNKSKILVGDCLKKSKLKIDDSIKFSLLHLDPARPTDIQSHTITEMQPPPIEAIKIWKQSLIETAEAIILDLSPRLSIIQCKELKENLNSILPDLEQTWEWSSQGRGRVDRLSVWIGAVATKGKKSRYVRNHPQEIKESAIIESHKLPWEQKLISIQNTNVEINEFISIIDPALIASGLEDTWLKSQNCKWEWIRKNGRRPLLLHSKKLELMHDTHKLIFESGIVRAIISHDIEDGVEPLIVLGNKLELMQLTLRLKISPELQPILQSKLDKNLLDTGGSGFIVKLPNNMLAICTKMMK
jgi:SAM-dependent methyltransferase